MLDYEKGGVNQIREGIPDWVGTKNRQWDTNPNVLVTRWSQLQGECCREEGNYSQYGEWG